jgi:DNA mismatch repair protein MutL
LKLDPSRIDINIHPTKTEIKFDDDHTIYAILRSAVKHSLGQFNISPILDFDRDKNLDIPYNYASKSQISNIEVEINPNFNPFNDKLDQKLHRDISNEQVYISDELSANFNEISFDNIQSNIFQLNNKYLVNKIKSGLVIINQNRAHERILYENFLKYITVKNNDSQKLLYPIDLQFSIKEIAMIDNFKNQLINSGFIFDIVGNQTLSFSSLPESIDKNNLNSIFRDLLDNLINEDPSDNFSHSDLISKSLAKSTSIKNGKSLDVKEMEYIVNGLFACKEPNISPSNKRTYITLTKDDLDNKFN